MIGDTIRKYRKLKGLTQPALCEMLNIHQTHISKIELNIRKPSIDILARIQKALDIPVAELLASNAAEPNVLQPDDGDSFNFSEESSCESQILHALCFITERQKKKVLAYALEQLELKEARDLRKKLEGTK